MIIKMVNEFKLTIVHFARPNPMQICGCAWIYRWTKKLWKIRTWPPGRLATGLPGLRAAGPSRAVSRGPGGLQDAGPLGRRGLWAAGLLLAKPHQKALEKLWDHLASAVRSVIHSTSWLDIWSLTWLFKNRQPPGRSSMIARWDFQAYSREIESCYASYRSEVGQENSALIGSRRYVLWSGRKGTFPYSRSDLEDGLLCLEYCSLHFTFFFFFQGKNMI